MKAGSLSLQPGNFRHAAAHRFIWDRQWPIKPDVVFEGGNWAAFADQADSPDDLALLTTHFNPTIRHFESFGDTSAATSLAANRLSDSVTKTSNKTVLDSRDICGVKDSGRDEDW